LKVGGAMVFDDTRMPSVHRVLRLLKRHYMYKEIDVFQRLNSPRLQAWYLLTTQSLKKPYRAFSKTTEYSELSASNDWDFWRRF
jgi:hypothetical protein